jgi:predicted P-loop ATPase/GTPase
LEIDLGQIMMTVLQEFRQVVENYAPLAKQVQDNERRLEAIESILDERLSQVATKDDLKIIEEKAFNAAPTWLTRTLVAMLGIAGAIIIAEGYWIINLFLALRVAKG